MKNQKGFTLIEVIVVAGIIAILAGILVPLIFKEIDESKISRAQADLRSISSAMIVLKKDTGQWPVYDANCLANVTLLLGNGNIPNGAVANGFDQTSEMLFDEPLSLHANSCYSNWKGPYIAIVTADPWGNAYITNAKEFPQTGSPVWIISAGPNGQIDTNIASAQTSGDDIGFRLQ
ncbi:MAG: type II secretion system protein GspG [Nitrospirota bacterium]